ncbi:MAG: hypothetical protein O9339_07875, partial [Rubrivivax sp.]|nr:hypothetical protein [Rubrivivax sp.]
RIGHDSQRTGWHPASRVRFAGLRPPLTPAASSNTTESTHSKFERGSNLSVDQYAQPMIDLNFAMHVSASSSSRATGRE